jgi:uroporphyrinogen-III synthase
VSSALYGKGILVTRPREQSDRLSHMIEQHGGHPILFPTMEIQDPPDLVPLHALIDQLESFDLAIFISPTAAQKAMNLIRGRREIPAGLRFAAIGKGSRKALQNFGIQDVITPIGKFDSRALLALSEMIDVQGRSVIIFRGEGGREELAEVLIERGARVEYAECYRRVCPNADSGALLKLWARGEIAAVTATSSEALRNLYDLVGKIGHHWMQNTPLFAFHPRIVDAACELGIRQAVLTPAGDEGLVAGMLKWFDYERSHGTPRPG